MIPYGLHDIDDDDIEAVVKVLKSDRITQGEIVEKFGQAIADYTGAVFGVGVSSGTSALNLSVAALGIGVGDEVITTPITFCATANAVLNHGSEVRFADIDSNTLNIDPDKIKREITKRTKAIIPVDFRGHPAALPHIREIADQHGLLVLEDASHALGSTYSDADRVHHCGDGIHADATVFSFHPVKHITTGEGGAVVTNQGELSKKIMSLRSHGIERRTEMLSKKQRVGEWIYDLQSLGANHRLTDIQAALGLSQLEKVEKFRSRRRQIVEYYNERFEKFDELTLPFESNNVNSNFHIYVLQVKENKYFDRYDLFCALQERQYGPMVHYIPLHLLSIYKNRYGHSWGDYPVAEAYYDKAISIPLYPSLSDVQVENVVNDIETIIRSNCRR